MNVLINCPCCHNNIKEVATILLDNIKCPLNRDCIFCLCEMNTVDNKDKLVLNVEIYFIIIAGLNMLVIKINQMKHLLLIPYLPMFMIQIDITILIYYL